jgi:hypothetical protein
MALRAVRSHRPTAARAGPARSNLTPGAPVRILWLIVPGFFVGWLVVDWLRRPFSDDPRLLRTWFHEQPVTVIAACTIVGSVTVWAVLSVLGLW